MNLYIADPTIRAHRPVLHSRVEIFGIVKKKRKKTEHLNTIFLLLSPVGLEFVHSRILPQNGYPLLHIHLWGKTPSAWNTTRRLWGPITQSNNFLLRASVQVNPVGVNGNPTTYSIELRDLSFGNTRIENNICGFAYLGSYDGLVIVQSCFASTHK